MLRSLHKKVAKSHLMGSPPPLTTAPCLHIHKDRYLKSDFSLARLHRHGVLLCSKALGVNLGILFSRGRVFWIKMNNSNLRWMSTWCNNEDGSLIPRVLHRGRPLLHSRGSKGQMQFSFYGTQANVSSNANSTTIIFCLFIQHLLIIQLTWRFQMSLQQWRTLDSTHCYCEAVFKSFLEGKRSSLATWTLRRSS